MAVFFIDFAVLTFEMTAAKGDEDQQTWRCAQGNWRATILEL